MAKIIKTFEEDPYLYSPASQWTFDFIGTDITVTDSTFNFVTPQVRAKYSGSSKGYASASANMRFEIGGTNVTNSTSHGWMWGNSTSGRKLVALKSGTVVTLTKRTSYTSVSNVTSSYNAHSITLNTGSFFNENNPTVKTLKVIAKNYELVGSSSNNTTMASDNYGIGYLSSSQNLGTVATVTLNVPPTFTKSNAITYNTTGAVFANLSTASVTLTFKTNGTVTTNSAKYGGYIKKIEFFYGNQSVSKTFTATPTSSQTLTLTVKDVGTFYPKIRVTDSRGQVTTESYPAVTVSAYSTPTASFTVERVNSNGVSSDALIKLNETWTNTTGNHLTAPTVTAKDPDDTSISFTQTWYTNQASDGTLSGEISDWSTITSMPVYGLTSGVFDTNKSYVISVTPRDRYKSGKVISQKLASEFFTIDFLAGGKGIAFGQPAMEEGFHCSMSTVFNSYVEANGVSGNTIGYRANCTDGASVFLGVGQSGTAHGVYSNTDSRWLVHSNNGSLYLGGTIFKNLFVLETHTYKSNNLSITSGSSSNDTFNITKAGYIPVAISGWRGSNGDNGSGGSHINPFTLRLSTSSVGSGTVQIGISAVNGAITNCSFWVDVLWIKNI